MKTSKAPFNRPIQQAASPSVTRQQGLTAIARRFNQTDIDRAYSSASYDVLRVR